MNMADTCRYLAIPVTGEQLAAGKYLESRAQIFCAHFGIDNAVQMADDLFEKECELSQSGRSHRRLKVLPAHGSAGGGCTA